ncbi:DUF6705 family protein [Flavobacterium sp. SUN052]|uniref:DUF6705 family protein n=1 Tax=Flavobacterium sp. SUN052 TaxID=3002441 RepID=UPI00237E0C3F|nr:DUF6705 family protein [Flavobacterium sp. SUN052]MEC4004947.1 DUF6705 family protein [Flavobacterium sp. SUN052]
MKKIILLCLLVFNFTCCKAQILEQQIVPIEDLKGLSTEGTYYKDVHNLLNPYVGTWLYTNGTTSLKFVFRKIIGFNNGYNTKDILVGEYEYIENGNTKINTLQNLNVDIPYKINQNISGNSFIYSFIYPLCNDCGINELRLQLSLGDPLKDVGYNLVLRKIIVGGQNALSAYMRSDGIKYTGDAIDNYQTEFVGATIPNSTYVLIKQP